jgi:cytochrome c oxidase subunit II
MTLYILFAALGTLIYIGVACAEAAFSGIATTGEPGSAQMCVGRCRTGSEAVVEPNTALPAGFQAAAVRSESARVVAAGRKLFQERSCVSCHLPDGTGIGPTLHGLFGSPVQDPTCGVANVDESYLRESILNPSATLAAGYAPVMPTFAGLLTEDELQALVEYLQSLSNRP